MKNLTVALSLVLILPVAASAFPYNFSFSGSDENGVGSATMSLSESGTTYTATLLNTSPLTTTTGATNSPGIDGFGFFIDQIDNDSTSAPIPPAVTSWTLTAYTSNTATTPSVIGSSSDSTLPWEFDYNSDNVIGFNFIDYFSNNGNGVDYALYNPLAVDGFGKDPYFTEAILTFTLASALSFSEDGGAFVRMQNVGMDGEGSLKLFDYVDGGGGGGNNPIPEPSTFILLGAGLAGLAFYRRKKN